MFVLRCSVWCFTAHLLSFINILKYSARYMPNLQSIILNGSSIFLNTLLEIRLGFS